jgi:class 3 adenylate cyclase
VSMLNRLCIDIDQLAVAKKVEKIKTIGDAYWAVCGLPDIVDDHAERMCDFGNGMLDQLATLNSRHAEWGNVQLRIGIHSGPLAGGILGTRQLSYEVFGETSHLAEEVEKAGRASKVTISAATLEFLRLEPTDVEAHGSMDIGGGKTMPLFVIFRSTVEEFKAKQLQKDMLTVHAGFSRHQSMNSAGTGKRSSHRRASDSHSTRSRESVDHIMSAEDAKRRRQQFLAERAAQSSNGGASGQSFEEVQEHYSKRKYNWVFFTFADPLVEEEFQVFVGQRQRSLRIVTRVMTLILIFLVVLGVWIDQGRFSTASTALFPISAAVGIVDLVLCVIPTGIPFLLQTVLHHMTILLLCIAAGLMPPGSSPTTNDITYLHGVSTMLIGVGNVGAVSSAVLVMANLGILVPVLLVLIWEVVQLFTAMLFLVQANIIIVFSLIISEKHLRQQFLESHVAAHMRTEQARRIREQHVLLQSIVPSHVVDELMVWLTTDLDPRKSIVKSYEEIVCCFVRLAPSENMAMASNAAESVDSDTTSLHEQDWLAPVQIAVDAMLDHFPAINKIKTVGDVLMLAGSFVDQYTPNAAAQQMLDMVWQLKTTISPKLQAGMHVGEIVGGVLGTNRLCFDIFGDSVNVTSRAMTGGGVGQIVCTLAYVS